MRAVGLKELRNRLSEYVQLACRGERVLVTNRDRVVAELVPPEPGRADQVCDALLADLVRQGVLTPPLLRTAEPPASAPAMPRGELLDDLSRDRDER